MSDKIRQMQKKFMYGLAVFGFGALLVVLFLRAPVKPITELIVWGPLEESEIGWERIIESYAEQEPNTQITFRRISYDDYERELIGAFARGIQPDLFYVQNAWIPKFRHFLTPMPTGEEWMSYREFRDTFVDVAVVDFTEAAERILAIPLFMETLALFYNEDLLSEAGIEEIPDTWDALAETAASLTRQNARGEIIQSGVALGTAQNINRATDIFALMALQAADGTPVSDQKTGRVVLNPSLEGADRGDVMAAYTRFADPASTTYSWNEDQWYSIDAFIDGRTAMMINYPHHLVTIEERAPDLSLGIAPAPQTQSLLAGKRRVDYANYWGLAVTSRSSATSAAWRLVMFLSEPKQQQQSIIRYTSTPARVPARRDLIEVLLDDPRWGVFARSALTAKSWYQPDQQKVEAIIEEAIDAVVAGTISTGDATDGVERQIRMLHDDLLGGK